MGFEAAYEERIALETLERLMDMVVSNGATGDTKEFKHTGEEVLPDATANTIKLVGLTARQNELRARAGLPLIQDAPNNRELLAMMRRDIQRKRDAK